MDIYQLDYFLHEPTEDHGWMYWAEIPALPGCAAWGDTPEQALDGLWGNARIFIEKLREDRKPLPPALATEKEIKDTMTGSGSPTAS